MNSTYVLSKRFGFIEWLIENNHLILRRDKHKILLTNDGKDIKVSDTDRLIMWLSIEEEPIDELIYLLR